MAVRGHRTLQSPGTLQSWKQRVIPWRPVCSVKCLLPALKECPKYPKYGNVKLNPASLQQGVFGLQQSPNGCPPGGKGRGHSPSAPCCDLQRSCLPFTGSLAAEHKPRMEQLLMEGKCNILCSNRLLGAGPGRARNELHTLYVV